MKEKTTKFDVARDFFVFIFLFTLLLSNIFVNGMGMVSLIYRIVMPFLIGVFGAVSVYRFLQYFEEKQSINKDNECKPE